MTTKQQNFTRQDGIGRMNAVLDDDIDFQEPTTARVRALVQRDLWLEDGRHTAGEVLEVAADLAELGFENGFLRSV